MDAQFEITSRLEKKHYVESCRRILHKRMWFFALFGVLGAVLLYQWSFSDDYWYLFWGIFSVTQAITGFLQPWTVASKMVKRDQVFYETGQICSVTKFADMIYDEEKYQTATVPYDKIKSIYFSKNTIVLSDIRNHDLIMDRSGFTKGSFEEFLPFIQEKCPQLKLPKW